MSDDLPKIDFRKAMEQNAIAASQWFAEYERAAEEACDLRARVAELEAALEIIAGRRQCMDNLMGNRDVAIWALDRNGTGGQDR